jgi:long-chain acyl-CoA synthetase
MTAVLSFYDHCAADPSATALIDAHGHAHSRSQLRAAVDQLSHALLSRGLSPGDTIAIVAPNCAELVIACLASTQLGMYFVPVNWHLAPAEIAYILDNARPDALFLHERVQAGCLHALRQSGVQPKLRVAIGEIPDFVSWHELVAGHSTGAIERQIAGRVMFYSSATTGKPKAIKQSLADAPLALVRTNKLAEVPRRNANVHLCQSMLYHAAGLLHVLTALHCGHAVVLMDAWNPLTALELIQRHRVTTTAVVPAMFVRLLKLPPEVRAGFDLSSLRQVLHGAAPCPVHVKHSMIEWLGPVLVEYYCSTEGNGTFCDSHEWLRYPGTVGRPFPGIRIRILDDDGNDLPTGQPGNIYLSQWSGLKFEYKDDPVKTAQAYRGEFFTVGDIGHLNDDGYLFISDRRDDVVNCGGVKVFCAEIENVLLEHPAVIDCAVVAAEHDLFGQVPRAVVQLCDGFAASAELTSALMALLADRLATMKLPRDIKYVAQLPRAPNGKIYKRLLRTQLQQRSVTT